MLTGSLPIDIWRGILEHLLELEQPSTRQWSAKHSLVNTDDLRKLIQVPLLCIWSSALPLAQVCWSQKLTLSAMTAALEGVLSVCESRFAAARLGKWI